MEGPDEAGMNFSIYPPGTTPDCRFFKPTIRTKLGQGCPGPALTFGTESDGGRTNPDRICNKEEMERVLVCRGADSAQSVTTKRRRWGERSSNESGEGRPVRRR